MEFLHLLCQRILASKTPNIYVHPVSVSLPQELRVALAHIWEEQKFTDVDFLIDGQVIPAHKAVLASQSQYFEGMLFGSMREAAMNSVELKDVPVPAFRKVLQFAYTGFLDMENVALQVNYMHCVYMVFCVTLLHSICGIHCFENSTS